MRDLALLPRLLHERLDRLLGLCQAGTGCLAISLEGVDFSAGIGGQNSTLFDGLLIGSSWKLLSSSAMLRISASKRLSIWRFC